MALGKHFGIVHLGFVVMVDVLTEKMTVAAPSSTPEFLVCPAY